jgi:hypothetical protein
MDKEVKKQKVSIFSWKMSNEEIRNQIDNYNKLKITQSYRGISVLITLALLGISIIVGFLGVYPVGDALYGLIIYLPILFFVYRGHRWAIILLMILWTFEKGYQLIETPNIMPIIWWAIIIPYFYKTLKVENKRKKANITFIESNRKR